MPMGRSLLIWRLALKDLSHNALEAVLLLLAIAAAATTLTLGLSLHGVTNAPYARTRVATRGPDAVASVFPRGSSAPGPAKVGELQPLEHAKGVVNSSGPFPVTWTVLRGASAAGAEVEGRSTAPAAVDQPKPTAGSWVRPGGVVVEAGFASARGLHVGDQVRLAGVPFRVVSTAVTAAFPSYGRLCYLGCDEPNVAHGEPGLVWVTTADAARVAHAARAPVAYFLNLKLAQPGDATTFANRFDASTASTSSAPYLTSWQDIANEDAKVIANVQLVLLTGSVLLVLLALASVAVLVGGRMAEQSRRVGLVKAVGGSPKFVATVLVSEHVLVGVGAAAVGLAVGWLVAPVLDGPGAGMLGAAGAPSIGLASVGLVLALAVVVAVAATFVPTIRAARTSTVRLLDDAARAPRRCPEVAKLSAHLPTSLLVGMRLAVRRPRRLLLNVLSVAATVSGIMAVLVVHATNATSSLSPNDLYTLRVDQVTTVLSVMVVVLAAVNAFFIAWATILDTRHASALARALGVTPGQMTIGISVAQILLALLGALTGIPGGIGIHDAAKNGGPTAIPAIGWLAVMVIGTVLAVAVLTALPARIGARRPLAEALQEARA